jgi:hypothetical protein
MPITRQLPRPILTALQSAAQANRFFSDMAHIDALVVRGLEEAAAAENARVMAYVASVMHCTVDELHTMLVMTQPAPDSRRFMTLIADRLFSERERLGLTRAQLADIGGITPREQMAIEGGEVVAAGSCYLAQVAKDAGIDVLYVLTGRRERTPGHA